MSDETATTRLEVAVRAVDRETFVAAAKARQQTLRGFLAETLSVIAADLRQPPRAALSWPDIFSRRADLALDTTDDDSEIRWSEPRPPRRAHLPTGSSGKP